MTHFAGRRAEDAAIVSGIGADGAGDGKDRDALDDVPGADGLLTKSKFDIEAIIRQRIWDEAFDGVTRKAAVPPSQRPQGAEDDAVETLNFEKSRVGLGDIYAQQYETEMLGHQTAEKEKEDEHKKETKALFAKMIFKLDQLTNAHFTPRPPMLGFSGEQMSKAPVLNMEEAIPLIASDALLKAPEEVRAPRRHERGREELTHDERKAARRLKVTMRRRKLEQKVNAGEMTVSGLRERQKKLDAKNREIKEEAARKKAIREPKKRVKSTELLAMAAQNVSNQTSRKEAARHERQARQADAPSSKRMKL